MGTQIKIYEDHNKTQVVHDANHRNTYLVRNSEGTLIEEVYFQNGPIKDGVANGVTNEHFIATVLHRIEKQNDLFPSTENILAMQHLSIALNQLEKRTRNRVKRGVEGERVR